MNYIIAKYRNPKIAFESCMKYSAYPEYATTPILVNEFQKNDYGCNAGKTKLEILSNGDVYPCVAFEGYLTPTSNILHDRIDSIWKNDRTVNDLPDYSSENSICKKCNFFTICNGGCPARNQMKNKSLKESYRDELCAQFEV